MNGQGLRQITDVEIAKDERDRYFMTQRMKKWLKTNWNVFVNLKWKLFSIFFSKFDYISLDSKQSRDWKSQNPLWNGTSVSCTVLTASQWVLVKSAFCFPCLSDTRLLNNLNNFSLLKPLHFYINWS